VSGAYTLKGTFTLMKPSGHTNYYGLIFGAAIWKARSRSIFTSWSLRMGRGSSRGAMADSTVNISEKVASEVVKKPDASGKSTNTLEVRAAADQIEYVVNGQVVHSTPKNGPTAKTDGIYGIRVNHLLEVQVDGLIVSK